jgi:type II secretory pathway component GspD/PulD (secretin)
MTGIPGLGYLPGVNQLANTNHKEEDDDELLVVITPHLLSTPNSGSDNEIQIGAGH